MSNKQAPRFKSFFLEVNPQADCFKEEVTEMAKAIEGSCVSFYAVIKHDKDIDENGEAKPSHYHIILTYENGRSESAVRKDFKGAHEEVARSLPACAKYLLHETPASLVEGKHHYDAKEVVTSNGDHFASMTEQRDIEPFNSNEIEAYYNEGTRGLLAYYRRFGSQINGFTRLIQSIEGLLKGEAYDKSQTEADKTQMQQGEVPDFLLDDDK